MLPRAIKRLLHQATLSDQSYRFMFGRAPDDEFVVIDCETTGLNVRTDDVVAIAAIKIRGNRILTSARFEAIVHPDRELGAEAIRIHHLRKSDVEAAPIVWKVLPSFLHFIGPRPLIGYYVDFDIAMLNKYILPLVGIELPNERIEVSRLYYDRKYGDAPPNTSVDLSFAAMLRDLSIPPLGQHDAFNDALMTAMMFVQLRDLTERGVRIPRQRTSPVFNPTGA
ncbi:3'-5' exonuclease [Bradyrhizobium sp. GCM10027634]|uniref:3'-5' exonuclease n=1 Tax=unclassified Bradyrhizobium TaxID=2631580 RepID=UPI00188AD9AE|nr:MULTISPECIES: 3'-5' exonuclease [unclassified Bradyrhizobium]MDN5001778.1 3'-5' exonuclease [Bradyrhizobium sp. WYCCWR 12677]QOZ45907.1 3'-5' exonuclease [Bradyrhizobium sp. CCBAU 53340]